MKKLSFLLVALSMLVISCNNQQEQQQSPASSVSEVVEEVPAIEEAPAAVEEPAADGEEAKAAQKKACNELKSWGAKNAYVDNDGYLVYEVNKSELSASGNEVAKSMYDLVGYVPGIKGVRVVDYNSKAELGKY